MRRERHARTMAGVVWLGMVTALSLPGPVVADAPGGRPVQIVGEQAQGGITSEEYFDRQQRLYSWLTSQVPAGARETRIRVRLSDDEKRDLSRPTRAMPGPLKIGVAKSVTPAVRLNGLDLRGISRVERPAA